MVCVAFAAAAAELAGGLPVASSVGCSIGMVAAPGAR